ncbi:hypothetical protein KBY93_15980 [Synechococcus sp. J7-Johnson]|nr:hypothetical protein [Synechococcus sp. J7-Johnson]MCP9842094.1 hypothetical protein [Synechococcus sp. J7-Johnson]
MSAGSAAHWGVSFFDASALNYLLERHKPLVLRWVPWPALPSRLLPFRDL